MHAKLIKPFHFKVFFSAKYVNATVLDKVTNVCVATVTSNHRAFEHYLGPRSSRNNERACELLGKMLAHKVKEKQVQSIYWDGMINQKTTRRKWHAEADAIWETMEDEGLIMTRDEPLSQKEIEDRRREAKLARKGLLDKESRIDPRFRQQMWKLMSKRPSKPKVASKAPASS